VNKIADKHLPNGEINQQWLAEEIASKESGIREVDIGQIKEILKITLSILAKFEKNELETLLAKHL